MHKLACLFLLLAASGCPDIKTDTGEDVKEPVVEFDPSGSVVPFPNNLLLNPMTGKVDLPMQCGESPTATGLRTVILNKLDGFGTFETALTVTFSEEFDMASLEGKILLYKRASGTTPVDPASATPIPTVVRAGQTVRFDKNCQNPKMIPQLAIIPRVPLDQKSIYTVALLDGIKTASGASFKGSGTWQLIRGAENPVTIEGDKIISDRTPLDPSDPDDADTLRGIDFLWNVHAGALKFLADDLPADKRVDRKKILLAWEFKTQTTTDPLDPSVAGSAASEIDTTTGISFLTSLPNFNRDSFPYSTCNAVDTDVQCFLRIALGQGNYAAGTTACQSAGCAAIGDVVLSTLVAKQYQEGMLNPYTGPGAQKIPGAWENPADPTVVKTEDIGVLQAIPLAPAPAGGYPVVVFQHGLGQGKGNALAIAGQLAALGFATVAIDAVAHDSRAVRISSDAARGCADAPGSQRPDFGPSPISSPQCYAPFLSTNLAAMRDGIRQTVLDQQRLVAALKQCGVAGCGALKVNASKIFYVGQSLGGILGGMAAATTADVKAAVLNVPGVGWADILENTKSLAIQCLLVDGLIDAGILVGEKSGGGNPPTTGLCTTPAWKAQPGYAQFAAIGRWILDPADPANYTRKLAAKRFLIQEVVDDAVVPNVATDNLGALVGQTPRLADPCGLGCAASAAITTDPMTSKWVRYAPVPADAGMGFPGNVFGHGSLLQPSEQSNAGSLGTARLRTDAFTFVLSNQ